MLRISVIVRCCARRTIEQKVIDDKKDAGLKESCIFGLFGGSPLEQEADYQIADADADECRNPAGELEGVVDDILAYAGGSRAVKADGCNRGGIVGQEEVAVDGWEQYKQYGWWHSQGKSYGEKGLGCGCLREEHDAEQEEGDGEKHGIGGKDAFDAVHYRLFISQEECTAHPGDAENGYHSVHA